MLPLDTMLENRFGFTFASLLQITVVEVDGHDVCRVNTPAATEPLWVSYKGEEKLFVRRNNSTRAVGDNDVESYLKQRFEGE